MGKYIAKRISLAEATLENEIWKEIPQTGNNYSVSSLGRIYSHIGQKLISIKPHKTFGYVVVPLGRKINRQAFRIHRLVAEAFVPNPFNKKEVNHKNKDKADNRIENLEWMNASENQNHKNGFSSWNNWQNRIAPTEYSVMKRKLEGFSQIIIPMLKKLVPLPH
jgi:hypothetical protein